MSSSSSSQPPWSDGKGGLFVLSIAPISLPDSRSLPEDSAELPRIHAAGDQSAVWRAGEAFIEAHDIRWPNATREHVTFEFLKTKVPPDFGFPEVFYHGEYDGRYYLVITRVSGRTIA